MENRALIGRLLIGMGLTLTLVAILLMGSALKRAESKAAEGKKSGASTAVGLALVAVGLSLNAVGAVLQRKKKQ